MVTVRGHFFARRTADSEFLEIERCANRDACPVIFLPIGKAEEDSADRCGFV